MIKKCGVHQFKHPVLFLTLKNYQIALICFTIYFFGMKFVGCSSKKNVGVKC